MKKIFLLLLLFPIIVNAREIDIGSGHQFQYSGYLGYKQLFSNTDTNKTFDNSIPEIGLNTVYNRGNFQIFNQFRYGKHIEDILVYNFAQYMFNIAPETNLTFRGGRIRHEVGLYNTSRVNPHTRKGIIMPQAIYWDVFDELLTSGNGVSAILDYKDIQLIYTIDDPSMEDKKTTKDIFYGGFMNSINTKFGSHQNAALTYSPKDLPLTLKTTWTRINFGNDTSKFLNDRYPKLAGKDAISEFLTFGGEYKFSKLLLSAEVFSYRSFDHSWTNINDLNFAYSYSATYELHENLSIRLNYNEYESKLKKKLDTVHPWTAYTKDLSLGLNYHKGPWMFQVEGHHFNGSFSVSPRDIENSNIDQYKEWWLIGTQIVYSF